MPFAFHSAVVFCSLPKKMGNKYICTNILHTGESNCVGHFCKRDC